jgi:exosortase
MTTRTYSIDDVKAVILVGGRDFGRCPTATRLNRALWPVAGKPVLQHLIDHIANQGVRRFAVCCENRAEQTRQTLQIPAHLDVRFLEETMPRGTAGCLRDAAETGRDELLLVFQACTLLPPDIGEMIQSHRAGESEMTVFFNPSPESEEVVLQDAQLYICEPSILEHIPQVGYFDIKEGLVPALVVAGKPIHASQLEAPLGHYKRWCQYLQATGLFLKKIEAGQTPPSGFRRISENDCIWAGDNVQIDESARLFGPIMIEAGARVDSGAVIFGPVLIGKKATIGQNTCIEQSVLWENAKVGPDCRIRRSLIDRQRTIPAGSQLHESLAAQPRNLLDALVCNVQMRLKRLRHCRAEIKEEGATLAELMNRPPLNYSFVSIAVLLLGTLLVSYWRPTVLQLWSIWMESDEYSSGLLVPFLAGYILWSRRKLFLDCPVKPAIGGVLLLIAAQAIRLGALYFWFASIERVAFVLSIGGIALLLVGWKGFRKFVPIFLFLFLMLPLPNRVEAMIALPLQQWATVSAVYSLETLGYSVIRQGNMIQIGETVVAVAEACNGLRMLTAFFVISGFVVLISRRKLWEKILILISTIPIALFCNTIRLTLTAIAFTILRTEDLEKLFHDFGGLAMMPLAIAMIVFELWLLKLLFNRPETLEHQVVISRKNS